MAGTDPSTNLVPGKNFTPPPNTSLPSPNIAPVFPDSRLARPVQSGGGGLPSDGTPNPGGGTDKQAPGPSDKFFVAGVPGLNAPVPQTDTDHRPGPSPSAQVAAPAPTGDLQTFGAAAAAKYGVPWNIFYYAIQGESSWNPNVEPSKDKDGNPLAYGIGQFTTKTAKNYGVDVKDPRSSLDGAARYLRALYQQSGSWSSALTGYLTGNSNQPPPLDVLQQNDAYRTAYRNAGYTAEDQLHQGNVDKIRRAYDEKAAHANEGLKEALKQLNSGEGDIGKAMEQIRRAREKSDAAQDAAMKALQQQPKAPVIDGVQHINGIAVLVGLLGGLMTKAPMLASTNAAAAALEAYNAGDLRAFHIAHDNWKDQTDYLFKIADMNAQRVRDVISEEKLPLDEKRAKVDALLRAMGLQQVADDARISGLETVEKWYTEQKRLDIERKRYEYERDKPIELYDKEKGTYYRFYPLSGRREDYPAGAMPASAAGSRGNPTIEQMAEIKRRDDAFAVDNPNATDAERADNHRQNYLEVTREDIAAKHPQSAAGSRAAAVDKVIQADVDDYKTANPQASKADLDRFAFQARVKHEKELAEATGRPARAPSAIYIQRWIEEHPGATAEQVSRAAASYTQQQTVERTFASGPTARNVQALNTVADHVNTVRKLAEAEQNGDIPRVNAILNQLNVESGYDKVTNLQTAANIMSDEIVRLLTSTGGTETDRRMMDSHFGPNMSPAQMKGALDVAEHMVAGRFKALEQGYAANDPGRRQYFENTILTPEAREMFARNQNAPPGGNFGATQDKPVHLSGSGDALAKAIADLPDGTFYVDPRDPANMRQK